MRDNYTNSLETPLTYNTEQKKLDTKKTYCVSLLRQSTVTGKTKRWGKESRQQLHLRSEDWRRHSGEASGGGGGALVLFYFFSRSNGLSLCSFGEHSLSLHLVATCLCVSNFIKTTSFFFLLKICRAGVLLFLTKNLLAQVDGGHRRDVRGQTGQ